MRLLSPKNRKGQALVESALSLLVYLIFILGTLELAQIMFLFQTFSDRARHALRMVCVEPYNAATSEAKLQNYILFGQATVPAGSSGSSGFLGLQRSSIQLIATIPGNNNNRLTVRVSNYSVSFLTRALVSQSTTISGRTIEYTHPYEQPLN
jgi:hypothetical protein